jgi:hypothetical protein
MALYRRNPTPDQHGRFDLLHFQPRLVHRVGDRCMLVCTRHAHALARTGDAHPEAGRPGGSTIAQIAYTSREWFPPLPLPVVPAVP